MKRLGIVSSRIAKGNFFVYNLCVILLSILFSAFVFVVAGTTIVFALTLLRYLSEELMLIQSRTDWSMVLAVCLGCLTVIVVIFNLLLLFYNLKFRSRKERL